MFSGCTSLKDVQLPEMLSVLESYCFSGCPLETLTLNNNLRGICLGAFGGAKKIRIPSINTWLNLTISGDWSPLKSRELLVNDERVTSITCPENLTRISPYAFADYTYLREVWLTPSVKIIGNNAFDECTNLEFINLNNVSEISDYAFRNCTTLMGINLESAKSIGKNAFSGDFRLYIDGPMYNVSELGAQAFMGCSGLSAININSGLINISEECFKNCTGISSLSLPSSLKLIGKEAFYGCTNIKAVELEGNEMIIGESAFAQCRNLQEIKLIKGIKIIGQESFLGTDANNIILNEGLIEIESKAFSCLRMMGSRGKTLVLPNTLTKIGECVFGIPYDVEEVVLPASLVEIGPDNFNFKYLKKVYFEGNIELPNRLGADVERVLGDGVTRITNNMLSGWCGIKSFIIPARIESISAGAFMGCDNLVELSTESSTNVISLENELFYNSHIERVTLSRPFSTQYLPFKDAECLKKVDLIESGLKILPAYSFRGCSSLQEIFLSRNLQKIDNYALSNCTALEEICFPTSITTYGTGLFHGSSVKTLYLLGSTQIPTSAFNGSNKINLVAYDYTPYSTENTHWQYWEIASEYKDFISTLTNLKYYIRESFGFKDDTKDVMMQLDETFQEGFVYPLNPLYFEWKSNDENIASVSDEGVITGRKRGETYVNLGTASTLLKFHVFVDIILPKSISISPDKIFGTIGDEIPLSVTINPSDATDKTITWMGFDRKLVEIANGNVLRLKEAGQTTIVAKTSNGKTASVEVTIYPEFGISIIPTEDKISVGSTAEFTVTITPSDEVFSDVFGTITVDGESYDDWFTNVILGNKGIICLTSLTEGVHTITATTITGQTAECSIEVCPSPSEIILSESAPNMYMDETMILSAKVLPENALRKGIQWRNVSPDLIKIEPCETEEGYDSSIKITPLQCGQAWVNAVSEYDEVIYNNREIDIYERTYLTVKANDVQMFYGDEIPNLEFTCFGGNVEGEPVLRTNADRYSPVGEYVIEISRGSIANEYLKLENGTLTILPAPLTIKADDKETIYGNVEYNLTASYSGFKNMESAEVLTKQPILETDASPYSDAGEYPINIFGAETQNYDISYELGLLTINKAEQTITWNQDFSEAEEGESTVLTAEVNTGLPLEWYSSDDLIACITFDGENSILNYLKAGSLKITVSQAGNNNYNPTEVSKMIEVHVCSGIDDLLVDDGFAITSEGIANPNHTPFMLFSLSGQRVYSGTVAKLALEKGFYILVINNQAVKIRI